MGNRWKEDMIGSVYQRMVRTALNIYNLACKYPPDSEDYKRTKRFALKTEQKKGLTDALELAKYLPEIALTEADVNSDPMLLNCCNGTYNLNTLEFTSHNPAHLITKVTPVHFQPGATAPSWDKFLNRIFDGSTNLIQFLKRAVGYTLTGLTSEQCLFFCYGTGANGKSVFFETMKGLFGDYWQKAPADMIMAKDRESGTKFELARLPGTRFLVTSELQGNQRLNEAIVKDLTGGDTIVARHLYKGFFEFPPTHKLWMYGNHKPNISGTDSGIWRRILLIPFDITIPHEERLPMNEMLNNFKNELSGIFNWAIAGYKSYKETGLRIPDEIKDATNVYREDSDAIGLFFTECCVADPTCSETCKNIFEQYLNWCKDNNEFALKSRRFSEQLKERGFRTRSGTGNRTGWVGLKLKDTLGR